MNNSAIKAFITQEIALRRRMIAKNRSNYKGKIFEQRMTNIIGWMDKKTCDFRSLLINHENTLREIVTKGEEHMGRLERYLKEVKI